MYDPNQTEWFEPNNNNNNPQEQHSIQFANSMELNYQNNNIHNINNHDTNSTICYPQYDENILHHPAIIPTTTQLLSPPPGLSFLNDMMMQDTNIASGSGNGGSSSSFPYDSSLFHLNDLPPQPSPLFRDLMFQSLPYPHLSTQGNVMNMNMNEMGGLLYPENGGEEEEEEEKKIMMNNRNNGKSPKNIVTDRQRRQNCNDKYDQLRSLFPFTPTKQDRASTVLDAIKYIDELKMTVRDLKLVVEKKRISKERIKRLKTEEDDDNDNNRSENADGSSANQLRCSYLQRKYKDAEVDVRIVDDEVTIKLVQRKKVNCLLSVSRTLDNLQLDLRHVAGGHVGDYYSYLFNSKICEGSSVYASIIADKLIEVVERQYAAAAAAVAVAPTTRE